LLTLKILYMKKITLRKTLTLCALLLAGCTANAQAPEIEWQKTYGGTDHESGNDVKSTSDGGYIIAGYTKSADGDITENKGGDDYWIIKTDNSGTVQWQKTFGGSGNDRASSIVQTIDGGYIVAGYSNSNNGDVTGNHGANDYWIVKLNSLGSLEWQKSFGGTLTEMALSIQQTSDSGYIVTGLSGSNNGDVSGNHATFPNVPDYWVIKLDASGTLTWQKCLGGSVDDYSYCVKQTADGGYIVAGATQSLNGDISNNDGGEDAWIVKLNSAGNMEWEKTYGGSDTERVFWIVPTTDGGYIATGWARSVDGDVVGNHGNFDYWVIKIDSSGNLQWQKTIGGTSDDVASNIVQVADGGYVVTGYSNSTDGDMLGNNGSYDSFLFKLTSAGEILWQKHIGTANSEDLLVLEPTTDGGYIATGSSYSDTGDNIDSEGNVWIVKLAPDVTTATQDISKNTLTLYPNPNNGTFTIGGAIVLDNAMLNVYSTLGQLVYSGNVPQATVSLPNLAAGVYQVQLTSGKINYSQKIVIE